MDQRESNEVSRWCYWIILIWPLCGVGFVALMSSIVHEFPSVGPRSMFVFATLSSLLMGTAAVMGIFLFRGVRAKTFRGRISRIGMLAAITCNGLLTILFIIVAATIAKDLRLSPNHLYLRDNLPTTQDPSRQEKTAEGTDSVQSESSKDQDAYSAARRQRKLEKEMVNKASEIFQADFKHHVADYSESMSVITNPPVLNMETLESREDLKERETKVKDYIEQSRALATYCDQAPNMFREELRKLGASEKFQESSEGKFKNLFSADGELHVLRETDVNLGETYLKALKFLDQNWGKWKWTSGTPHLKFEGGDMVEEYNDLISEINRLRRSEADLQTEVFQKIAAAKRRSSL